MKLSAAITA